MPTVSIIVPVHNAAATLPRCVQSILSQEYRDLELILVDDGSTDESPELCDDLAEGDDRVIVIHQQNAGVSGHAGPTCSLPTPTTGSRRALPSSWCARPRTTTATS